MLNVNIPVSEWPDGAEWMTQDSDGRVDWWKGEPAHGESEDWWVSSQEVAFESKYGLKENPNWKTAIISRAEQEEKDIKDIIADKMNSMNKGEDPLFTPPVVRKHNHYHKSVVGLESIDVYRVLELYGVTDPCFQHAIKKLLVAGGRGDKDTARDIQEAIDTLQRWQEMQIENQRMEK